jgi:hypothetical protein
MPHTYRKPTFLTMAVLLVLTLVLASVSCPAAAQDDGRINPFGGLGAPVAIYFQDGEITVYVINPDSEGEYLFAITAEEIEAAGIPAEEEEPIILREDVNPHGDFEIIVSRLATGEFRFYTRKHAAFNPPDDTEPYIVQWMTGRADAYTLKE